MKRRKLMITPDGFLMLLTEGEHHYLAKNIPDDVKVIEARYNNLKNVFEIVLESEKWGHLKEGSLWEVVPNFTNLKK